MSSTSTTDGVGGVSGSSGRVILRGIERDVLAWLWVRTADSGATMVKSHHYPGDVSPRRVGKAIARLRRHNRSPLEISRWNRGDSSSAVWSVQRR